MYCKEENYLNNKFVNFVTKQGITNEILKPLSLFKYTRIGSCVILPTPILFYASDS
jgi:hypothetical protein